jgi:predicted ATPase/DNA-binding SARP family transcriptional activator
MLGPLEVTVDGHQISLGGRRQRALLALLLLHANTVVSRHRLIDGVWGGEPPPSASESLDAYLYRLRTIIGPDRLPRRAGGYVLRVEPGELDVDDFDRLVAKARQATDANDTVRAVRALEAALALWRGPPLADLSDEQFVKTEITLLEQARLAALEDRIEAELRMGRGADLVTELQELAAQHPLRERLAAALMIALYRAGRQADALAEYQAVRRRLIEELGLEPGPALQELERRILQHDPALSVGDSGAVLAPVLLSNFPVELSTFIGRDKERSEVRALVESCRLVTLTGAGGCGKTRLGLQVAAGLLDGLGDGVWLVELAAVTDADAVAPAIWGALRLAAQPGRLVLQTLLDALASQNVLIVLDNCEHLISACATTAEAILRNCPGVRLLATSREPLSIDGEIIYRVPSLSLPGPDHGDSNSRAIESSDAVALLMDRARTHGVALSFDEQTGPLMVSVCRRLDGMPLAIELAAARLRSMSLPELGDRLDQRFRLLTGGSRTAMGRHQTLRAAVGWSYGLLTDTEQLLLSRLSVFADGFNLGSAEAVCGSGGVDGNDVAVLIGSLVDKSLVVAERAGATMRYRLLETIRLFAAERLAEAGEDTATAAAHCAHFVSVAETAAPQLAGPDQRSWLERLDADQANLRRAAAHASAWPDGTALMLRLGVALEPYWETRSRQQETLDLLAPALQRPDACADPVLFAAALIAAAAAARFIDIAKALNLAEQGVRVAGRLGNDRLLVRSLGELCRMYYHAREPRRGLPLGQEAVERARQLGDDILLGESLLKWLTNVDPPGSGPLFAEAIACTERSGDLLTNCRLHNNAGDKALIAGDIPAARAHLEAAAQAGQAIGFEHSDLPNNMGHLLRAEGDLDAARFTFETGLRTSRRNGDSRAMAYGILGLACLASDARDWNRAGVLHGVAQAFLNRIGSPWQEFDARCRQDSLDQAREHLGDPQLECAYAYGMALSLDQAHELILRKADPA